MSEGKTLKETDLELLEKYRLSEESGIYYSEFIHEDLANLKTECDGIRKQIEETAEPKKGKWMKNPDPYGFFDEIPVCSQCGCTTKWREEYKYCPNCGAEMEVME